jgi:CHASE2 domain-containing sensor protein
MKSIAPVRKVDLPLVILAATALLLLALEVAALYPGVTTPVERIEYSLRDLLMRVRGVRDPGDEIVIVAIDDFSFNWTGYQWPWPRAYLSQIVS